MKDMSSGDAVYFGASLGCGERVRRTCLHMSYCIPGLNCRSHTASQHSFHPLRIATRTPLSTFLSRYFSRTAARRRLSSCNTPDIKAAGLLATAVVLSSTSPVLAALFLPLGWVYAKLQRYYRSSSRELRRLDSTSR